MKIINILYFKKNLTWFIKFCKFVLLQVYV
jgi:hypothetical protein